MVKVKDEFKRTTIQVYTDTRARLIELGKKGETYDEIINHVIDGYTAFYTKR